MLRGGVAEMLCSTQGADEEILGDELFEVSTVCAKSKEKREVMSYMSNQDDGGKQTRKRKPIAHLLHQDTRRAKRRRRDVRSTIVVHNNANGDIDRSHDGLAQRQGLEVVLVVLHLRYDVEVRRNTAEREDDTG